MTPLTAIIAGSGALPALLMQRMKADGASFVIAQLEGVSLDLPGNPLVERFCVERLVPFFDRLHELGVTRVVFAGAVSRPALDPQRIDPRSAALLPRLVPAFQKGDDALLRAVIALFEEAGFDVVGPADLAPDLVPGEGVLTATGPSDADRTDAERAAQIVAALGAVDVGQGAVVAQGLCLAVETLPGTAAMLRWVADVAAAGRPDPQGARGVVYKAAKPGQELRVDMPVIGADTVAQAAAAGLAGIVIEAGRVMIVDRAATLQAADDADLFLWARRP